jgi:hypothetical protein
VKAPTKTVTRAVADRLGSNNKTSVLRATVTAVAVGGAVGATVYRVLRN